MTADMYLPVTVHHLPAHFVFQPDGAMRTKFARASRMGVVRVIAGPLECHVTIDVKRPYFRALEVQQ